MKLINVRRVLSGKKNRSIFKVRPVLAKHESSGRRKDFLIGCEINVDKAVEAINAYTRKLKEMPIDEARKISLRDLQKSGLIDKHGNPTKPYKFI